MTRALLAVCLAGALALAGCADSPTRDGGRGPVTVVFKHAKLLGPVDPMGPLLAEFAALHPEIRVRAEALP
ncbi:MAG TPA: hypothetical protein VFG27_00875, partial [Pseudomonadales bacterium]|nr:hypothetical protein [Pseudomonadales bacterium]